MTACRLLNDYRPDGSHDPLVAKLKVIGDKQNATIFCVGIFKGLLITIFLRVLGFLARVFWIVYGVNTPKKSVKCSELC